MTAPDARQSDEPREALARWMFERSETWRDLCSPEDADWDEWVERNRETWREEVDVLLSLSRVTDWAEKQARERAAEAWDEAANELQLSGHSATHWAVVGFRRRADALAADDRTDPA